MRSELLAKRVEALEGALDDVDLRLSDLVERARAFAEGEGLADRPEYFRSLYLELGEREVLARVDRILAELADLDPARALERTWLGALARKADYHLAVVRNVKAYRDRLARLMRRPATPLAPPEVEGAARLALAACEEMAALPERGWTALRRLGEVRWLLGDRAGAIAALEAHLQRAHDGAPPDGARELLDAIRAAEPPGPGRAPTSAPRVVATASLGDAPELAALRRVHDQAMSADPAARDFFHVFWSRYDEGAPRVARIAGGGPAVREHLRWAFLEPWLAWLDLVSECGRAGASEIPEDRKLSLVDELLRRRDASLAALPPQAEGRRPSDDAAVFAALDRVLALLNARAERGP